MTDRLEEIRDVLASSPDDLRLSRELLAALNAAEEERDELKAEVHEKNAILHERYYALARAEEALRRIDSSSEGTRDWHSDIARAYFAGKSE